MRVVCVGLRVCVTLNRMDVIIAIPMQHCVTGDGSVVCVCAQARCFGLHAQQLMMISVNFYADN